MAVVSNVIFEQNPPANLRKSNFFSFVCRLFDAGNQALHITSATCVGFIENKRDTLVLRNGVRYKLSLLTSQGEQVEDYIHVIIVDSETNQIVPFQGQDRNPSMTKVLLTHESICSRCAAKKSCGNKNDTPADPVIQDHTRLKVFLKCNQNCLINAGNPRELRKFKLAISGTVDLSSLTWAYSTDMFVHNNSKHGRVAKSKSSPDKMTDPSISIIWPQPGPICGGRALIVGRNFTEDTHVLFGTTSLHSEVITPDAIQVEVPPATMQSVVVVTLIQRNQLYQKGWHYKYSTEGLEHAAHLSVSPLNLTPTRINKPFTRQYPGSVEQLASFSSMLGIGRETRARCPPPPHSPTYPPPPLKPIPISANKEAEDIQSTAKASDESPFSFSKEGSAFSSYPSVTLVTPTSAEMVARLGEEAARLETATILQSLKTRAQVPRDFNLKKEPEVDSKSR